MNKNTATLIVVVVLVIILAVEGIFVSLELNRGELGKEIHEQPIAETLEENHSSAINATLSAGNQKVVFERENGEQEEYTLLQWREQIQQRFGVVKIPVSNPVFLIDIDPIYITEFSFVSLSPDGKKAFLLLKVQVPVMPGGRGGISAFSLEVLDLQKGPTLVDSRDRLDIYLSPVQVFWSPNNRYIAVTMNDTVIRRNPKEHLYLCETVSLDCWNVPNHTFATNLGISSLVSVLDFRDFQWDLEDGRVFFSTNVGNLPPPLGEARWELELEKQKIVSMAILEESPDFLAQRAEKILHQKEGDLRVYEWFRCRERVDFQDCNDLIRSLFIAKDPIPSDIVVLDEKLVGFFNQGFVRFPGQEFSVVFRGKIAGYIDEETVVVLYHDSFAENPDIGTIFIQQNGAGEWIITETVESLSAGLLRDIERLLKKAQENLSEDSPARFYFSEQQENRLL